jgi:hypothetical protein
MTQKVDALITLPNEAYTSGDQYLLRIPKAVSPYGRAEGVYIYLVFERKKSLQSEPAGPILYSQKLRNPRLVVALRKSHDAA